MRRLLHVAVLALGVTSPSLAGAGEAAAPGSGQTIVGTFEEVSQVCTSEAVRAHLAEALRAIPPRAAVTILAYSDATEMREKPRWRDGGCVAWPLPAFIGNHERIAALRALHMISLGRAAGVAAFGGAPELHVVLGEADYRSHDPSVVAIVVRRSTGSAEQDRRVEVTWTTELRNRDSNAPVLSPPSGSSAPTTTERALELPGTTTHADPPVDLTLSEASIQAILARLPPAAPVAAPSSSRRPAGWSLVAAGIAGIAVGGGLFGGSYQQQEQANATLDRSRLAEYDGRVRDLRLGAAAAGGVGVVLLVAGATLLGTGGRDGGAALGRRARASVVTNGSGVGVAF